MSNKVFGYLSLVLGCIFVFATLYLTTKSIKSFINQNDFKKTQAKIISAQITPIYDEFIENPYTINPSYVYEIGRNKFNGSSYQCRGIGVFPMKEAIKIRDELNKSSSIEIYVNSTDSEESCIIQNKVNYASLIFSMFLPIIASLFFWNGWKLLKRKL